MCCLVLRRQCTMGFIKAVLMRRVARLYLKMKTTANKGKTFKHFSTYFSICYRPQALIHPSKLNSPQAFARKLMWQSSGLIIKIVWLFQSVQLRSCFVTTGPLWHIIHTHLADSSPSNDSLRTRSKSSRWHARALNPINMLRLQMTNPLPYHPSPPTSPPPHWKSDIGLC